jgi:hypothetical protein
MKLAARIYLPIGLALLLTTVAHANTSTVTFSFSGNVTSVDPLLSSVTKPGDPITGVYTTLPSYSSTTVIVGVVLVLLMNTNFLPEMRIVVVPLPTFPVLFAESE